MTAMVTPDESVSERLAVVREHIEAVGRSDVTIVAVTKGFDRSAIDCARRLGLTDVGENYAQELLEKREAVADAETLSVHFMGRLQRNKVRKIVDIVDVWHSVDRPELLREIGKRTETGPTSPRVLIQVRPHDDTSKAGIDPTSLPDMLAVADEIGLPIAGLMTIGVLGDAEATRRAFDDVARLADEFGLHERSMGMSGDYRDALSTGATMLRLGSVLFGPRPE